MWEQLDMYSEYMSMSMKLRSYAMYESRISYTNLHMTHFMFGTSTFKRGCKLSD